ncbi:hypothetical protein SAMN05216503_3123 [Polaribacter sp. KT25b]|uniref:hypothetical protein n=1 Tax=Polaribacter sp. KT25b TaxID=1855336 RepID=UPI00087D3708|nr:hypothetical protein [Polaribacter sp. KT25b]SDS45859.1 hypothetical protein SAMN05216503_3123 [Polaribacter sp. KT25b]
MKTIKRRILVVVFMLGTLLNYANNDNEINKTINASKVKIVFENVKKGQQLTVNDKNGVQLHSETIYTKGKLIKFFDLSPLNDGLYTIELHKEFEVIIKSLEVKDKKVVFIKDSEKVIFKPLIRNEENRIFISKINFDKKPLKIDLYFNGEIVYSETVKNQEFLNRVLRLDDEIAGDYKITVNFDDDNNYTKEFKL